MSQLVCSLTKIHICINMKRGVCLCVCVECELIKLLLVADDSSVASRIYGRTTSHLIFIFTFANIMLKPLLLPLLMMLCRAANAAACLTYVFWMFSVSLTRVKFSVVFFCLCKTIFFPRLSSHICCANFCGKHIWVFLIIKLCALLCTIQRGKYSIWWINCVTLSQTFYSVCIQTDTYIYLNIQRLRVWCSSSSSKAYTFMFVWLFFNGPSQETASSYT